MQTMVSDHLGDYLPPVIEDVTFDLDRGVLTLYFDEVVEEASFDVTKVRLIGQNGAQYDLIDGSYRAIDLPTIEIILSENDLNNIKADFDLAVSMETVAVKPRANLVSDTSGNMLLESSDVVSASLFLDDNNRPNLEAFSLDLDSDILILTFNETIDPGTVNISLINLQPSKNSTGLVSLSGSTFANVPSSTLEIEIGYDAITEIQRRNDLATARRFTFISFSSNALNDSAGNPVSSIFYEAAKIATNYVKDDTQPTLNEYALDLDSDTLSLTFSETVNANSVNFSLIHFKSF